MGERREDKKETSYFY